VIVSVNLVLLEVIANVFKAVFDEIVDFVLVNVVIVEVIL
jgi:hypothetical protein